MRRPLHVLTVFNGLQYGGDERRMLHYARAASRSARLSVLTLARPTPSETATRGNLADLYTEAGVGVYDLGFSPRGRWRALPAGLAQSRDAIAFAAVVARLVRWIRAERVDVLDLHGSNPICVGGVAGRLARVPAVATEYTLEFWQSPMGRPFARQMHHLVGDWVTDSRARAADFGALMPRLGTKVRVVENGIHPATGGAGRAEVRRALGLRVDACVVAQISRLVPYKGQEVLIEAMRPVLARRPDVQLLICGFPTRTQAYADRLRDLAASPELAGRVVVCGYPGPIEDVWAAVDVHAHASMYDSAPIALHESMSLGLPRVSTTTGGIPDLIDDGVDGLLVPPDDAPALGAAIGRVLDDPDLAARLGAAGCARFLARHQPEQMAHQLDEIFVRAASVKVMDA